MPVEVTIRLRSLEEYVIQRHGSFRQLDFPEIRVVQRGVRGLVEAIANNWPVDTGYSRDRWNFVTQLNRSPFQFTIDNDAFYSQWVHLPGGQPEEPFWRELIPLLAREYVPQIIADTKRAIDATEARLATGGTTVTPGLLPRPRVAVGARP